MLHHGQGVAVKDEKAMAFKTGEYGHHQHHHVGGMLETKSW
jgi:hypothetical protein